MKITALFLTLLLLMPAAISQPFGHATAGYRIKGITYENSSGEQGNTTFSYDKHNRLREACWLLDDGSRSSVNTYTTDEKGHVVAAGRIFSDGITTSETFKYNDLGQKVHEDFFRSDSVSGSADYFYENGMMVKAIYRKHKGWLSGSMHFRYADGGKKNRAYLLKGKDTICSVTYKYNRNGNMTGEDWDFGGRWKQWFRYRYEATSEKAYYYSSPLLSNTGCCKIVKEYYTYNQEVGGPSIYHYNDNGLLYKKEFIRSDGVSTITFYEYDRERRLVSSQRAYSDGKKARFTYQYNNNNELIRRNYYANDSLAGFEVYTYDPEGRLKEAEILNFDNWLSGSIAFDHDASGKPVSGRFSGSGGFDAGISISYNDAGMLCIIRWEFSFGKFQQYTFEYEK